LFLCKTVSQFRNLNTILYQEILACNIKLSVKKSKKDQETHIPGTQGEDVNSKTVTKLDNTKSKAMLNWFFDNWLPAKAQFHLDEMSCGVYKKRRLTARHQ
jgi:hypothetical protein